MTSRVFITCEYTLLREQSSVSNDEEEKTFDKIQPSGRIVHISLSNKLGLVTAHIDGIDLDDDVTSELKGLGRFEGDAMSRKCSDIIRALVSEIHESIRLLLSLVKYHLRHYYLSEALFSVKSEQWGTSLEDLHPIPTSISVSAMDFSHRPLNGPSYDAVKWGNGDVPRIFGLHKINYLIHA